VTFYRNQEGEVEKDGIMRLELVDDEEHSNEVVFCFLEGATEEVDVYDSRKFFGSSWVNPSIATCESGSDVKLMLDSRPSLSNEITSIPLVLKSVKTGTHQLRVTEIDYFPIGTEIYLEDKLSGTLVDMTELTDYNIRLTADEEITDRFVMHFRTAGVTSLEDELESRGVNVFASGQQVYVNFKDLPSAQAEITVFDISGREVLKTANEQQQRTINIDGQGIFIIHIENEHGISAKRVYVGK
jgi:hypothetical protein